MKVVFGIPTLTRPFQQTLAAIEASVPLLDAAGLDHHMVSKVGCPYISAARSVMLRQALDAQAEVIVFIDHDVSWDPDDLVTLIQTPGDVVCGTYRYKRDDENYMGAPFIGETGRPLVRSDDGCVKMHSAPAGFLKITRQCVQKFIRAYPGLVYGDPCAPSVDMFNHGAHGGQWWGEDYAFCRNWREAGGEIWCVPDLNIAHHTKEKSYPGNYHRYLIARGKESNVQPLRA